MRIVIAEDEPVAREHLHTILRRLGADVVAVCANGRELVAAIESHAPDAAFVDIEMPELNGLAAIGAIVRSRRPRVVFVTAHDELAVRAFDLEAVDYVTKPFQQQRIAVALDRVSRALPRQAPPGRGERFLVVSTGKIAVVEEEEIEYVEAAGNYVRLHTATRQPLLRETLRAIEQRLDAASFVRTHRSFLVRIARIRDLRALPSGDSEAILESSAVVPVSRTYRDAVLAALRG